MPLCIILTTDGFYSAISPLYVNSAYNMDVHGSTFTPTIKNLNHFFFDDMAIPPIIAYFARFNFGFSKSLRSFCVLLQNILKSTPFKARLGRFSHVGFLLWSYYITLERKCQYGILHKLFSSFLCGFW